MDFENVNKEYIKSHNFKYIGLEKEKKDSISYRLGDKDVIPLSPEKKLSKLRRKCADIVNLRFKNDFKKIELNCDITENTMRKYINGSRNITKIALAKLCVGVPLEISEADEMFILFGSRLDIENNLFDAILVDNLKKKEGIDIFLEECKKYKINI